MGRRKHPQQDQNFDGLTQRFQRNIYNTMKGQLRMAVLHRDFDRYIPAGLNVLDVGAGQGHWALELLRQGQMVTLTDISQEMLILAQTNINNSELDPGVKASVRYQQCAVQSVAEQVNGHFDLIVCHALMEWLDQPQALFSHLQPLLKRGTWVSMIFYNRNGLIFKNLLRTNYKKVSAQDFRGARGSLTPLHPLDPADVQRWGEEAGLVLECHSGIRVFHDYILDPEERKRTPEQVLALELEYSQKAPFRDLGRYVHFLWRKS